jgi:small subunit ribosomal protein S18
MSGLSDEPRAEISSEDGAPEAAAPDAEQSVAGGAREEEQAGAASGDRPARASGAQPREPAREPPREPGREPARGRPSGRGRDRDGGRRERRFRRPKRKVCAFCVDKVTHIDYKDHARLRDFVSDRGKILKSRMTGTCGRHQRKMARAVKRARHVALLPYVSE